MTGPDQDAALWRVIRLAQAEVNGKPPPGNGSADPSDQEETGSNQQGDDHGGGDPPKDNLYPRIVGPLDFASVIAALNYEDDEHMQVANMSTMPPELVDEVIGGDHEDNKWHTRFTARVLRADRLVDNPDRHIGWAMNWWFGVCPVDPDFKAKRPKVKDPETGEMRPARGRPNKHEITRIPGVWTDLDFKAVQAGGCGDRETAERVTQRISEILGVLPALVTASGHGLQPIWCIEDGQITAEFTTADANTLLARFGELTAAVASEFGAAVDGVFEAGRVLRMPGSINHKIPTEPVPAAIVEGARGGALSLSELNDRLDEFGIQEAPRHRARGEASSVGPVVSEPGDWLWATETCRYTTAMVAAWVKARPGGQGRHPWLMAQWVRLACAHRNGCITEIDYHAAEQVLTDRFVHLCATTDPRRAVGPGEIESGAGWSIAQAARKDDADLASELGRHQHGKAEAAPWDTVVGSEPEFLKWCRENIGTGPSSGVFLSPAGELTITRAIGETGYVPPPPGLPNAPADTAESSNGSHTFERITKGPQLSGILRYRYSFVKWFEIMPGVWELRPTAPPMRSITDVIGSPRDMSAVRHMTGAITAPCLLPDGSLLTEPGYHDASGLVYLPAPGMLDVVVPEEPTKADAERAVKVLTSMLTNFGFVKTVDSENRAIEHHRANYLAAMITPAIRRAVGCVPLVAISAGDRGSGKTTLSLLVGIPYGGAAVRGPLPRDNEDEVAKILGTIWLTSAAGVVVFDNQMGVLKSENFAALATGTVSVRMLGSNASIVLTSDRLVIVNGNNVTIGGDHDRRFMWVRVDPGMPEAWKRPASAFEIGNLLGYAQEHRFDMLAAILTMVRAWVVAGRPQPDGYVKRADNFADWHEMVSGILAWAGVSEPVMHESTVPVLSDPEAEEHADLLRHALKHFPKPPGTSEAPKWTAKHLALTGRGPISTDENGKVWNLDDYDWVPSVVKTDKSGRPHPRSLTQYLSNRQERFAGGLRAVPAGRDGTGTQLWTIETYQTEDS